MPVALSRLLAIPLAMLWSSVAAAQAEEPDVVVHGQALSGWAETRHAVAEVSQTYDDQLARMDRPVCAVVLGLASPYDGLLAQQIDASAASLTGRAGPEHCQPDLQVIFFDDVGKLLRSLRRDSSVFGTLTDAGIRRLVNDTGPVRAWRGVSAHNEDGTVVHLVDNGNAFQPVANYVDQASYILVPTHQVLDWTVIVIEQKAAEGKSLSQLADFAAMVAVTGARIGGDGQPGPAGSILSLFSAQPAPQGVSGFDRDYVKGLYCGAPNVSRVRSIARISATIMKGQARDTSAEAAAGC